MFDLQFVGPVGVALYGCFLLFSLTRTFNSFVDEKWKFTFKSVFHVCITIFYVLNLLSMAVLCTTSNDQAISTFAPHWIGILFNLCGLSCVVLFWSKTLPFTSICHSYVQFRVTLLLIFNILFSFVYLILIGNYYLIVLNYSVLDDICCDVIRNSWLFLFQ